jgi:HD-GYP domain-containing protein (c-di-GMP phosphodiesterase class II)
VAFALSDALDLVGVGLRQHGKRVAFMARLTGRTLGLEAATLEDLFLAGLLHDCGVSSTRVHRQLIEQFAWEGTREHCRIGHDLLAGFEPFEGLADLVLLHHTRWDADRRRDFPAATVQMAGVIHIVDRVDALAHRGPGTDPLMIRHQVCQTVASLGGTFFAPAVVEAFIETSVPEAFWLTIEPHHLDRFLADELASAWPRPANAVALHQLARMFARVVDGKSRFTAEHSAGVARLARLLGTFAGLPPEVCEDLGLAGLLHDLGKLSVPDEILEKRGSLDPVELAVMKRHAFETWQIVRRIGRLKHVAAWAAWHHEMLSGGGYPFHLREREIPLPARIMAVADVFQALSQPRPYRDALLPARALEIERDMVRDRQLDGEVVDLLARNLDSCRTAATASAVSS